MAHTTFRLIPCLVTDLERLIISRVEDLPAEYEIVASYNVGGGEHKIIVRRIDTTEAYKTRKILESIEWRIRAIADKLMYDGAVERRESEDI